MITIILTSLYASRLDQGWRWGLLVIVGMMMAVLFMLPFSFSWLVISFSYIWLNYAKKLFPSYIIRLTIGSMIGSVAIVILSFGQISMQQLIYGLAAVFVAIIWLKRHRFYLR
ncbi:MAG: hypothetical protein HN846_01965 [Candidatus Pacebacteria bacterium]|nr:hypothetical protein [Candidatus Paceibacterota bacterium]MBT3512029.1 hypothetical protein [Candidatus Paceibacterota bacterium]MBT4004881.1 hypothetical protein [Candidatus Paceibacterota bacterium]MBT6898907.1 hypothetical protein [Candidatus Paceibacterota bacterium]MBT7309464.1 hypothetical protein [Candidatus Paceibacterota bacterium]